MGAEPMAPFDLSGKKAFVTGAGRGLGRASSLLLARAGADVAVASRSTAELESLAEEVRALGRDASVHELDICSVPAIQSTVQEVIDRHGRIDILVNNAGTNVQQDVVDVTEADWDLVQDTNLKGAFFCAQAVGRHMVERGSGKIINMCSTFANLGFYGRVSYAASKGGLAQVTRVMAIEWSSKGVNVNSVGPTATMTKMNEQLFQDPAWQERVMSRIPAGRWAEPEDVAGAVLFLASPASDMVHGHMLMVDGGWSVI
jgi:NAD(P)-dependent dehydrogenase (short-subunit alcohol dehydrogenase family)